MTRAPQDRSSPDDEVKPDRRSFGFALLGAVGASTLLGACAEESEAFDQEAILGEAAAALTGTTNIRWVNKMNGTVSDEGLRNLTGAADHVAILTGYYAAGDKGGGLFVWSTSPALDDGGTIINPAGGTNAGWRRLYSGAPDARWFGIVGDGSTADKARIQAALSTAAFANVELNVQQFGILPDGNDVAGKVNHLIAVLETVPNTVNRTARLYFPAAAHSYDFEAPIEPPEGNHLRLYIRGDGWYTDATTDVTTPGTEDWGAFTIGGTCLRANGPVPDQTVGGPPLIAMRHVSDPGGQYRRLVLSDIALSGGGGGTRDVIAMHGITAAADAGGGQLLLRNVLAAAGRRGIRIASVEQCEFYQVSVVACEVGIELGDRAEGAGVSSTCCYGLQILGCNTAIHVDSVVGFTVYGGLIQGNTTLFRFEANAGWNHVVLDRIHFETYTTITSWLGDPLASGGFEISRSRFGSGGNMLLKGNGWTLSNCLMGGVSLTCTAGQRAIVLLNTDPASVTAPNVELTRIGGVSSLSGHAAEHPNVSGSLTLDVALGFNQSLVVVGAISIALPAASSVAKGTIMSVHIVTGGSGNNAISWTGAKGLSWSNAGQSYGASSSIQFQQAWTSTGPAWYQLTPQTPWAV